MCYTYSTFDFALLMSQKLYRHVLRDAWSVTWRHPALWIFGAFALFMGQSQFFYSLAGLFKLTALSTSIAASATAPNQWFIQTIAPSSFAQAFTGFVYAGIAILFLLIFVFVVIQSQGAIMAAGDHIFRKKLYSFKASWHASLEHFWGIVGVLLVKIIAATAVSAGIIWIGYIVNSWPNAWWPRIVFIGGFVVLALLDILITFISLYATCFVVLEKQRVRVALTNATRLFLKHWLASIEIGVIFLICNVVATTLSYFIFIVLLVPLVYIAGIVHAVTGLTAPVLFMTLGILVAALWFIMAVYTTWFFMSIVILFDHMLNDSPVSKVVRFLHSLISR